MDPAHKRRVRLVVALSAAVLLAAALIYTSFSASSEAKSPSELARGVSAGQTYQLVGKVVDGSIHELPGGGKAFRVRDREGSISVPVRYASVVPDTFRDGREIVVKVRRQQGVFVGEPNTLSTKCPSKFTEKQQKN